MHLHARYVHLVLFFYQPHYPNVIVSSLLSFCFGVLLHSISYCISLPRFFCMTVMFNIIEFLLVHIAGPEELPICKTESGPRPRRTRFNYRSSESGEDIRHDGS